jgi:hypothetical protein
LITIYFFFMKETLVMGSEIRVSFRNAAGAVSTHELAAVDPAMLVAGRPWRVFRWRQGQAHYSGWYWCATTGGHVVYESRLELARLLLADFDASIVRIAAQPFLVSASAGGRVRRHVPDFLFIGSDGLVSVVNVKPVSRIVEPKIAAALDWAAKLFADRGWQHEIWSGMDAVVLSNVRFLAAYRHMDRVAPEVVSEIERVFTSTTSIGEVEELLSGRFEAAVCRPAVLHLVWRGVFHVQLDTPLSAATVLERVA